MRNTLMFRMLEGRFQDVLSDVPDGSAALVLTDPPYGETDNDWDVPVPFAAQAAFYSRVIRHNGVVAVCSKGLFTADVMHAFRDAFKYKWVWEKSKATNFLNVSHQPLRAHEEVCIFYAGKPTYNPQMVEGVAYNKGVRKDYKSGSYGYFDPVEVKSEGLRYPRDVLYFATAESEGPVIHPTQKPLALAKYMVLTYTNPDDLVVDPFMGSGTIAKACYDLGRRFAGAELLHDYWAAAVRRVIGVDVPA